MMSSLLCRCAPIASPEFFEPDWTTCARCNRPRTATQTAAAVEHTALLAELGLLGEADMSRALLERLAYHVIYTGDAGRAEAAASQLWTHLSAGSSMAGLSTSAFFLTLHYSPARFIAMLEAAVSQRVADHSDLDEFSGAISATGLSVGFLTSQCLSELANAALIAALVAPAGSAEPARGKRCVRSALEARARLSETDQSTDQPAAELVLEKSGAVDYYSFDPARHRAAELFLSALWHHHHGDVRRKDEVVYVLAPAHGRPVVHPAAFHWGAFTLAELALTDHPTDGRPSLSGPVAQIS